MDVLALIGVAPETQQILGGAVPPFHGAAGIGHDHAIAHGVGGFLHPIDLGPQPVLGSQVGLVQFVKVVENIAPQADALRGFVGGAGVGQPLVETPGLKQRPPEIDDQPEGKAVNGLTEIEANQGGANQATDNVAQVS